MTPFDPSNPIGGDNFQIARPMPVAPHSAPHVPRAKRAIPEVDELFATQRALIKAINILRSSNDPRDVSRALERTEGAYRRLRGWLADHGNRGL